jgi:hypothetical protein
MVKVLFTLLVGGLCGMKPNAEMGHEHGNT